MTVSLWCLLIAAFMPMLSGFPGKLSADFDNARPRDPDYWRSGFRARARGAMDNGFEAFPLFAAAVLVALTQAAPHPVVDGLAVGWVAARAAYTVFYWTDRATPRSLAWVVAFACAVAIFLAPLWAGPPPA
jgi:uncharacterized MAPEG superfamily protein